MRTVTYNWHELELYDSIEELNIVNYQDFNRYGAIDMGIGSDLESINDHFATIYKKIEADQKKEAMQEVVNLQSCLFLIMNGVSPELMSFACLVKSIDGKDITDHSESGLKKVIETLKEKKFSMKVLRRAFEAVKKNWKTK